MKKILIFLFCLLNFSYINLCCNFNSSEATNFATSYAKSETTTYAKALVGCVLYKNSTMSEDLQNIYFVVPETYFVTVIENINEAITKVQYDKYIGYVHSSTILIATFIPIVKTLDGITCDIKETSGTQVWTVPSAAIGSSFTVIPAGTKSIKYIASVYGTIPSGGESNLWYYVNYTPATNSTNVYEGYIYSENATNLTEIVANTEDNPDIIANEPDNNSNDTIYVSSPVKTLIIAIIAVPIILLVAILLYKLIKKIKENDAKKKNIQKEVNQAFETDNYGGYGNEKINDNYYANDEVRPLKNKIEEMKNTSYIRKRNSYNNLQSSHKSYPDFPTYDSEDDML